MATATATRPTNGKSPVEGLDPNLAMHREPPELNRGVQTPELPKMDRIRPQILVDWLSFTLPMPDWTPCTRPHAEAEACDGDHRTPEEHAQQAAQAVAQWMGLKDDAWDVLPGRYFYAKRLTQSHVDVLYAGIQPGMGIHVQVTGQGCRELEEFGRVKDWEEFLGEVMTRHGKVRRIDVAVDDRAQLLDMQTIYDAWRRGDVTSRYQKMQPQMGKMAVGCGVDVDPEPETLYFGDPRNGESGIRIYNKQLEQIAKGQENPGPWIRVELVAKADQADELIWKIAALGWEAAATGAIRAKLDFKTPELTDSRKDRWRSAPWWDQLLGDATKVKLSRRGPDRTITDKIQFLLRQASRNLAIVNLAHDNNPATINYILLSGEERIKDSDRRLIAAYRLRSKAG